MGLHFSPPLLCRLKTFTIFADGFTSCENHESAAVFPLDFGEQLETLTSRELIGLDDRFPL